MVVDGRNPDVLPVRNRSGRVAFLQVQPLIHDEVSACQIAVEYKQVVVTRCQRQKDVPILRHLDVLNGDRDRRIGSRNPNQFNEIQLSGQEIVLEYDNPFLTDRGGVEEQPVGAESDSGLALPL